MLKYVVKSAAGMLGLDIKKLNVASFRLESRGSTDPCGDVILAKQVLNFTENIDFFYEKQIIPPSLEIAGAWRLDLIARRKKQIDIYMSGNVNSVAQYHENMFFNELIMGLWNYGYLHCEPKINRHAISNFLSDFESYAKIFPTLPFLVSDVPLPVWGHSNGTDIIRFTDIWHSIQANHLADVALYIKKLKRTESLSYIEIGSGFGGLAEKLAVNSIFNKLVLIDIPHNLVTAYYYLGRCVGVEAISIVSSRSELERAYLDSSIYIILCPSCFYESVHNLSGPFIFGNFGSFSEMDYESISFYLNGLPKDTHAIVQINSNEKSLNTGGHVEVSIDEFPITNDFVRIYGGQATSSASSGGRYKTSIHIKAHHLGA